MMAHGTVPVSTGSPVGRWILVAISVFIFCGTFLYVINHEWAPVRPIVVPSEFLLDPQRDKDAIISARTATASAIQESASLLVTIALAFTALFGFSVANNLGKADVTAAISLLGSALFGLCLTATCLAAYEIYRAIAIQMDQGLLFLNLLQPLIAWQAKAVFGCAIVAALAFAWRCITLR